MNFLNTYLQCSCCQSLCAVQPFFNEAIIIILSQSTIIMVKLIVNFLIIKHYVYVERLVGHCGPREVCAD